jgi:hypothetical protein
LQQSLDVFLRIIEIEQEIYYVLSAWEFLIIAIEHNSEGNVGVSKRRQRLETLSAVDISLFEIV